MKIYRKMVRFYDNGNLEDNGDMLPLSGWIPEEQAQYFYATYGDAPWVEQRIKFVEVGAVNDIV